MTIGGKGHSRRLVGVVFLALVLAGAVCVVAFAAPGDLDRRFGRDGKLTTNFRRTSDGASAVAIQADGRIVVAGQAGAYPDRTHFGLARYRAGGTLDPTFGGDGKVITRFAWGGLAADLAIQADGKIVVVGETNYKFVLAHYNRNGTLDSTFDGNGKATTSFLPLDVAAAASVAVQADGEIVVAGSAWCEERTLTCPHEEFSGEFAVARYNEDGTLDASFDEDGRVTTDIRGNDDGRAVALQADGKIVVAGGIDVGLTLSTPEFGLVRYNADGSLDSTFGDGGKVTTNFLSSSGDGDAAYDLVIQPDGKIVAAGRGGNRFALARYNADGTPDATFSSDGKVMTTSPVDPNSLEASLSRRRGRSLPPGWLLADSRWHGTTRTERSTPRSAVNGKVTTDFTPYRDGASDLALQAGGKIVLAGYAGKSDPRFALARYRGG